MSPRRSSCTDSTGSLFRRGFLVEGAGVSPSSSTRAAAVRFDGRLFSILRIVSVRSDGQGRSRLFIVFLRCPDG